MAFTHVPAVAKNKSRIMKKIVSVVYGFDGTKEADQEVGAATIERARRRVWTSTGSPSTGTVTGIALGDLCLDIENDEVYRRVVVAADSSAWEQLTA